MVTYSSIVYLCMSTSTVNTPPPPPVPPLIQIVAIMLTNSVKMTPSLIVHQQDSSSKEVCMSYDGHVTSCDDAFKSDYVCTRYHCTYDCTTCMHDDHGLFVSTCQGSGCAGWVGGYWFSIEEDYLLL